MKSVIHKDRHPSAYRLLGATLHERNVPGVVERAPDRWLVDWDKVDASFLSSTEAAYLHIARGLAVLDTNGPGPAPGVLCAVVDWAAS